MVRDNTHNLLCFWFLAYLYIFEFFFPFVRSFICTNNKKKKETKKRKEKTKKREKKERWKEDREKFNGKAHCIVLTLAKAPPARLYESVYFSVFHRSIKSYVHFYYAQRYTQFHILNCTVCLGMFALAFFFFLSWNIGAEISIYLYVCMPLTE